jgi:predicted nucleic acid-binding protein
MPGLVIDTNVCLDLFVFEDPRVRRLREVLQAQAVAAWTDEACRAEWLRVLDYPQLGLDHAARQAAAARFDGVMRRWPSGSGHDGTRKPPRCRDPDDQKFLDLAVKAGARWLLSRDEHLLSLARRATRDDLFEILTPQAWMEAYPRD